MYRVGVYLSEAYVSAFGAPWAKPTLIFANCEAILDVARASLNGTRTLIYLVGNAPCGRKWTAVAGPYWLEFAREWAKVWDSALSSEQVLAIPQVAGLQCFDTFPSLESRLVQQGFQPSG